MKPHEPAVEPLEFCDHQLPSQQGSAQLITISVCLQTSGVEFLDDEALSLRSRSSRSSLAASLRSPRGRPIFW
ncbi:MAG: hypothetical protein QOF70_3434 [Acetobacteraceae bacterium]|jgi:hypothetical protein|nr:hypothetical protein [Acetobacteraceae bacterium]